MDLTNKFRAGKSEWHEGGLRGLQWNQQLHDIALQHSKDMADGRVPFGHANFDKRNREVTFYKRSFSENVVMGTQNDPERAVNAWINSPGHRKNMLATNTICAIAVY